MDIKRAKGKAAGRSRGGAFGDLVTAVAVDPSSAPNNQLEVMLRTLNGWRERPAGTASRRLHAGFRQDAHHPGDRLCDGHQKEA
ncbi:MAG: hypothetical protein NTY59_02560 [Alphaproteobacteria bacterium]|nr:hypothetical protein [Alphaproteobacteria bacterium]